MAADHDYTVGGNAKMAWAQAAAGFILTRKVDIAALLVLDAGTDLASATKITATEDIGVISIPDNTWVAQTVIRIITPSTDATATIDFGDETDVEGWDAACDITAAAGTNYYSNDAADAYNLQLASGKLYSAANHLDVLFNNDTTNGVFLVMALCFDFSNVDG